MKKKMKNFKEKVDLIWCVVDLFCGDYKQLDYGKVILLMMVFWCLDCVLQLIKQRVFDYLLKVELLKESVKDIVFNKIVGFNFYNRSQFDFDKFVDELEKIVINFWNYINGFFISVWEIIEYFNFDDQID